MFFLLCTLLAIPGMVTLIWVAPWRAETVPAAHGAGSVEPMTHALPAGHSAHSDALAKLVELPYVPSLQSRAADAPLPHHAPLSHGRQAVEFWSGWWVPAGHTSPHDVWPVAEA